jgi:hypothetical protein
VPREEEGDPMIIVGRSHEDYAADRNTRANPDIVGYTLAELRQKYKQVQYLDSATLECIHPAQGYWHYYFKGGRRWRRVP